MAQISIRVRLTLWYSLVLLAALTLFGAGIWLTASQRLMVSVDAALVEQKNAMVGVAIHDGHPQIVLNVNGARAASANFDNAVLKVARLVE